MRSTYMRSTYMRSHTHIVVSIVIDCYLLFCFVYQGHSQRIKKMNKNVTCLETVDSCINMQGMVDN